MYRTNGDLHLNEIDDHHQHQLVMFQATAAQQEQQQQHHHNAFTQSLVMGPPGSQTHQPTPTPTSAPPPHHSVIQPSTSTTSNVSNNSNSMSNNGSNNIINRQTEPQQFLVQELHTQDNNITFHPLMPGLIAPHIQFFDKSETVNPRLIDHTFEKYLNELQEQLNEKDVLNIRDQSQEQLNELMVKTCSVTALQLNEIQMMNKLFDDYVKSMYNQLVGPTPDSRDLKKLATAGVTSTAKTTPKNAGKKSANNNKQPQLQQSHMQQEAGTAIPTSNTNASTNSNNNNNTPSTPQQTPTPTDGTTPLGGSASSSSSPMLFPMDGMTPTWDRDTLERMYSDKVNFVVKKKKNFTKDIIGILDGYFFSHLHDPYPSDQDKQILLQQTGLSLRQLNTWFGNKRMRYKRKMLKQQQTINAVGTADLDSDDAEE
jgi:hypothetical protein